ncbi:hypothetical protein MIMGU_mgv1a022754mg [Erythranthe guttata]|uniref:non-specific serine/threonine protein kinase n=1 Tax=Erythranthe guttata TaxID=4155 RepID=A0A022RBA3_ERYGU|nr:hypothetical protein MIMGU_mgv1a022754mg [Erythranthe guttata]
MDLIEKRLIERRIIFSCLALHTPSTFSSNNQTDFLSLLAMKKSIDVDPNGALNSWNRTTNFCRWNGITCGRMHPDRVVAINLGSEGLIGSLSPHIEIGLLRRLEYIEFSNNSFFGSIPKNMSQCKSLVYVNLINNDLSGNIPLEISLLYNLQSLYLGKNTFSGHIPQTIGNLTSLGAISLRLCGLIGEIPKSFSRFRRPSFLQLAQNNLTGTIPPVGKIHSEIGSLVGLKHLRLSNNNLEGPIPLSIGRIFNLQILELGGNRLTSRIPPVFGNLTLLYSLSLERNNFSGTIPTSLANCTKMQMLDLSINNFDGPIPQEILISTVCNFLDLSHNALTNSIPLEFGSLRNLEELDLSNNKLSGLIPRSLGTCVSLEGLYLHDNLFEGEIPKELSSLMGLTDLDLSLNNLSGSIPSFLGNLNLSFNSFQGRVPTTGVFKNTSAISLEGNIELCGGILELDLPPCTSTSVASKKKNLSTPLKIGIPVAGVAAILCFVVFIYKRRTPDKNMPYVPSFTGIRFLSLSYADLLKGTSGFAETNLVVSVCESIDFRGNDFKALVYEFKAKGSLDKWLCCINSEQEGEFRNLDLIERLGIAIDVAHAREYLHCGIDSIIIHGDLKPSNILLDEDMTACVGDFGLSKITSSIPESSSSSTIGIRGTFGYVPPEYGMSNSVSTKGDVYSYGILVLEMFTNRRPSPTDDSLSENGNLQNFVSAALPNRVMEIVDPLIRMGPHMIETVSWKIACALL